MKKKETREILWCRISKSNMKWLRADMKRMGYKSQSAFVDALLDDMKKLRAGNGW